LTLTALGIKPGTQRRCLLTLLSGKSYVFTLKRRPGTLAMLCDHRFLCALPLVWPIWGTVAFTRVPAGIAVREARYVAVSEHLVFGDDFMRQDDDDLLLSAYQGKWAEDPCWEVAFGLTLLLGDEFRSARPLWRAGRRFPCRDRQLESVTKVSEP